MSVKRVRAGRPGRRGMPRGRGALRVALAAGVLLPAAGADATWSIILVDTRTGEIAIGCATCLTTMDLQEFTPVLLTGVGAGMAQSAVNGTQFANRTFMRDRMALGTAPGPILSGLAGIDSLHASRQYGMADVLGRRATFTGPQAGQWAGGLVGSFTYTYLGVEGSVTYAIQGNVLTGAPVVQQALAAARDTPGDLPARLMAAMEAARAMGGDGRCSCTSGGPTGCGSPPPAFTKSAHIGYMIVARAGDVDGSQGYYRTGGDFAQTAALALRDFDGDGMLDIAAANPGDSRVGILRNTTPAGSGFATFSAPQTHLVGTLPGAIAAADFNGDGIDDLVTVDAASVRLSLLTGMAGGAFSAATAIPLTGSPTELAVADFDGSGRPDVAVLSTAGSVTLLLNDGTGGFGSASVPVPAGGRGIIATQLDGAAGIDLVVPIGTMSKLAVLLGDGAGAFAPGADIPTAPTPHAVAAGDFDGDGDTDLAVAHQGTPPAVSVLQNTGAGFPPVPMPGLDQPPNHIAAGDVNGDGDLDLVLPLGGAGRFIAYFGAPGMTFGPGGNYDITAEFAGNGVNRVALGDADNDGDLDAVFAVSTFNSAVVCENLGGGVFQDGGGSASGAYFMNFDVASQPAGAEDPVLQMQAQFDAWRAGLVGIPDAVQSRVAPPHGLIAGSSNTGVMTITLRDWQGVVATSPVASVTVGHAPGSAGSTLIGPVTSAGPGVYEAVLTPSALVGTDRFEISVDIGGPRPIVLMPHTSLDVERCPADWNADDAVTSTDISSYLAAWLDSVQHGNTNGDFNGDMAVNSTDISVFLARWLMGVAGAC